MAEKKTGIRVNELAKELGVESKSILSKLKSEGIENAPVNHQGRISLGLAESVREWFASGDLGGGTAVEVAPPEAPPKLKRAPAKKKKAEHPEEPVAEAEKTQETEAPAEKVPLVKEAPPAEIPAPPPPAPPPAPAIAAEAPAPVAPPSPAPPRAAPQPPQQRPTITLASRSATKQTERKAITPAPQLVKPTAAVIQGPRVVREERPDIVPAPRPRRGPAEPQAAPFTTARPATGRGVKTDDDEEADRKKAAAKKGSSLSTRRRGPDGRRGEADEKLREFTEADLIARRDAINAASAQRRARDHHLTKIEQRGTHVQARTAVQKGEPIGIEEPITVKSFSAALGVKTNDIIARLMKQNVFATVNQALDRETASVIAMEYGIELQIKAQPTQEEELIREFDSRQTQAADKLVSRPPVVTILGHVDHGKTSLLDKIRTANVAAGEAGGITQHTAAWMVTVGSGKAAKRVTFIDTPGHQAFTSMRARGANMTDVVVLVVSAAEGVQPQTIESINHARAAGVPIVVAMNKIDRADANEQQVLGQLANQGGLNALEYGGDTEVIRTSATTGQGISDLIETLDLQSQLLELKANPDAPARGTVIESKIDPGLGPVATVLVQDGTLKVGDTMLSGPGFGRIRQLFDDLGKPIREAGPSTPVIVSGLSELPGAGDKFYVVDDLDRARAIAGERAMVSRQNQLAGQNRVTIDNLLATIKAGDVQTINLIIKADVQGSIETLTKSVTDQNTEEVKVRVIHSGVGEISESDVQLAMATKAKPTDNRVAIIGFHVTVSDTARALAEQNHVDVKLYRVIYEIFDDLKKALSGMLTPEEREKLHGHAEIRQVFKVSRVGNIAGCMVTDGHIQRGSKIRLIRDGKIIVEDLSLETLRRVKDDVKEVKSGFECGIKLANYDDIKIGDRLEAYVRETFERTL